MSSISQALRQHLEQNRLKLEEVCVLEFSADWELIELQGNANRFSLQDYTSSELGAMFREICAGLSRTQPTEFRQMSLPNGKSVDLFLFPRRKTVSLLLVDVVAEVEKLRVWQQSAQETQLHSYEKSRELRKARGKSQVEKQALLECRKQLALERARRYQLLFQIVPVAQRGLDEAARLVNYHRGGSLDQVNVTLWELGSQIRDILGGRVTLTCAQDEPGRLVHRFEITDILLPLLMFLHARSLESHTEVCIESDLQGIKVTLSSKGPDLDAEECAILWQQNVPDRDLSPAELPLFLFAPRLSRAGGRVTRTILERDGSAALRLIASIPVQTIQPVMAATTKQTALPFGAEIWLLTERDEQLFALRRYAKARGFELQQHFNSGDLLARIKTNPPSALVVDATNSAACTVVFKARSAGYQGIAVALGALNGSAGVKAAFNVALPELSDAHFAVAFGT